MVLRKSISAGMGTQAVATAAAAWASSASAAPSAAVDSGVCCCSCCCCLSILCPAVSVTRRFSIISMASITFRFLRALLAQPTNPAARWAVCWAGTAGTLRRLQIGSSIILSALTHRSVFN